MREITTAPQLSDRGDGHGYIEGAEGRTLEEVLNFIRKNTNSWGVITILNRNNYVLRKFDYNTFNGNNLFYHKLDYMDYKELVKTASYSYCFMNQDIFIMLA